MYPFLDKEKKDTVSLSGFTCATDNIILRGLGKLLNSLDLIV